MSERMPEDMSEKDAKKYFKKGRQKIYQTRMLEDMPERMSIETLENMSEKDVRRYVRKNVRIGCQKRC